ncbi:MAG: glycosyltransferase family 2 protein [Clostridia bacterium]|nr:glycosyltransferase family 2 protein [Clostridia bacterium]
MRVPEYINNLIFIFSIIINLKQIFYLIVALLKKDKYSSKEAPFHHYAVMICARNEAAVIADLIDSIKSQSYPQDLIDIFVMADNCSDSTADIASSRGAHVYTRFHTEKVGKGYALAALMNHIREDYPEGFDGYFVFDADNILEHDYIEQMNRKFSDGHDIVTGFRNSKNFADNWISAGNSLWFLWDSKYLNYPRYLLGISCTVSGTGFLFSRRIAEKLSGWPYHMLTEDWQFSFDQVTKGEKIAFCRQAVLYDEQPTSFIVSCRQRIRWCRGLLEVNVRYMKKVFKGIFHGSFSCFDIILYAPTYVLSVASLALNLVMILHGAITGDGIMTAVQSFVLLFIRMYVAFWLVGVFFIVTEWKTIRAGAWSKLIHLWTFPFFTLSYVPLTAVALFYSPKWKPIRHTVTAQQLYNAKKK